MWPSLFLERHLWRRRSLRQKLATSCRRISLQIGQKSRFILQHIKLYKSNPLSKGAFGGCDMCDSAILKQPKQWTEPAFRRLSLGKRRTGALEAGQAGSTGFVAKIFRKNKKRRHKSRASCHHNQGPVAITIKGQLPSHSRASCRHIQGPVALPCQVFPSVSR